MIKLSNLIKENISRIPLTDREMQGRFTSEFKTAYNLYEKGTRLYRGSRLRDVLIQPSKSERHSKDFNNLYTVLLSNLPSWRGWPRRSFSVIFTNDENTASSYGPVSHVFPKNDAKIVCAHADDMTYSDAYEFFYDETHLGIHRIGNVIGAINNIRVHINNETSLRLPKMEIWIDYNDYRNFIDLLNKILTLPVVEKILPIANRYEYNLHSLLSSFLSSRDIHAGDWEKYFDYFMDPVKNRFELVDIKDIGKIKYPSEMWTESDCILTNPAGFLS